MCFIYGLLDPDTLELRYVGKTTQPKIRYRQHLFPSQLKPKTHRNAWIKLLLTLNKKLGFIILERDGLDGAAREIAWIAEVRWLGANLVNGTNGEDDHKVGHPLSLETRRKIGLAHLGAKRSPEQIANMKASQTKKWAEKRRKTKVAIKNPNFGLGFIGVSWYKVGSKWRATFQSQGKQFSIGYYERAEGAARGYDAFILQYDSKAKANASLGLI